jgi:ATP-binding cassette subfamily B protein RaxB
MNLAAAQSGELAEYDVVSQAGGHPSLRNWLGQNRAGTRFGCLEDWIGRGSKRACLPCIVHDGAMMAGKSTRSVRPIQQSAVAECGLACAAMILNSFDKPVSLQQLRQTHDTSIRGSNLRDILIVLGDYGLNARPLRLELDQLEKVKLPCVLHWSFDHFVILERWTNNHADIVDPNSGRREVSRSEVDQKFTGIALEVTAAIDPKILAGNFKRLRLQDVLPPLSQLSSLFVQIALLTILLNFGALILPLFVKFAIDRVDGSGAQTAIVAVTAGFLLLGILQGWNRYLRGIGLISLRKRLSQHMAHAVFGKLIWLNNSVVERRSAGTIAANYRSIFALSDTLGEDVVSALIDAVAAIAVIGIMLYYSWTIGLLTLVSIVAFSAWTGWRNRGAKTRMGEVLAQEGREGGFFVETINRLQAIRLFQAEVWRGNAFATIHHQVEDARNNYANWNNISRAVGEALLQASWVAIVGLAAGQLAIGQFDAGLFSAMIVWIGLATSRARDAVTRMAQIDWLESHVDRLSDIILSPSDYLDETPTAWDRHPQSIGCQGIAVRYAPNLPLVFDDLSFEVHRGEWVTIVGSSGEGKTTLAKALTGLLPIENGSLLIDGQAIPPHGVRIIRRHVGAVMQNDGLLAGSLRDNIAFFDQTPDLKLMVECAEAAEIADDIAKMPMQYDSVIGEQGAGLSAGQGQRLMLARCLYKRPGFLILDEFTANIDEQCEQRIIANLKELGIGIVAIAHRSNVINAADRVLELDGTHLIPRHRIEALQELQIG